MKDVKARGMHFGYGNERLQIGAIKFFADSEFGRRTALLSEPYHDAPEQFGEAMHDQATLFEMFKR